MSTVAQESMQVQTPPAFTQGIRYFGEASPEFTTLTAAAVITEGQTRISRLDDAAVYQTLLAADALRYLTLQTCGAKASGHPGGFASSAEASVSPA